MYTFFIIVIVLASLLLTGIVLVQDSKGGGLASGFSSTNQIMGVRKTTDFVEKMTWGLVITIVVLSVASVAVNKKPQATNDSEIKEQIQHEKPAAPGVVNPNFGETPEKQAPANQAAPAAPAKK